TKMLFIITIVLGVLALITAFIAEGVLIVKGTELIETFQSSIADMGFDITLPFSEIPHLTVITGFILLLTGIALAAYIFRSICKTLDCQPGDILVYKEGVIEQLPPQ
ncbi:MAG: hypothetical protein J7L77_03600, partial [Clostridiales bacterium]|nr:hypothetical protein [Clostridiales bacterium]